MGIPYGENLQAGCDRPYPLSRCDLTHMENFRTSDGLRLCYVIDDYTDPWRMSDTLVMVHAAMGSSRRFYAWVPHLARDFRVVRFDLRGHGETDVPGTTIVSFQP